MNDHWSDRARAEQQQIDALIEQGSPFTIYRANTVLAWMAGMLTPLRAYPDRIEKSTLVPNEYRFTGRALDVFAFFAQSLAVSQGEGRSEVDRIIISQLAQQVWHQRVQVTVRQAAVPLDDMVGITINVQPL